MIGRSSFWRTWMLVVDPHVCGKTVVGFHLFCWIMVQIHGQNSIVCDSVQYCSRMCVWRIRWPIAFGQFGYRLKVYELFQHRWFHTQNSQPLGPLVLPKACQMPQKLSSLMPWAQMPHATVLQLIGGFMTSFDFGWKNHELLGGLEHGSYDFPIILGMESSSQLSKSIIFRGVGQPPTSEKSILIWWWMLRQFRWNSGGTKDPTPHNSSIAGAVPGDARASMGWYFRC